MKFTKILLLLFTFVATQSFAQETYAEKKIRLHAFDSYLDSLVDALNYRETHLSFCKLKKVARRSKKKGEKLNKYINLEALEILLTEDLTLAHLKISSKALEELALESDVQNFENGGKTVSEKRRMFKTLSNSKLYFTKDVFENLNAIDFYDATVNADTFETNIGNMTRFNSVHYLYECMKSWLELNQLNNTSKNYEVMEKKMVVLKERLLELSEEKYYKYDYTAISNKKFKDISVHSDNDVFMPTGNQDMNLTGGLHIDIGTDFMKMRLLPYINGDNILSYQTFNCGFDVLTPYIRDTNDVLKLLSYSHDRPFASTQYFGRTKYRLHRRGHIRHTGKFQLVIIGGQIAPFFQKLLHKDVAVTSIKPVGWHNQIGNGGRLGFKVYHKFDFMLLSEHTSIFNTQTPFFKYLNPFISVDGQVSHEKTFIGGSLTISTRDFFNASGNYQDFKLKKLQKYRFDYVLNLRYQYIFHNSLLEDFGLTHRYDDDPFDDEYLSNYYLQRDQINRNLFSVNLQLNYRYRMATFFYRLSIYNKEFKERSLDDLTPAEYAEYGSILEERFKYQWYGYGTIGLVFNL